LGFVGGMGVGLKGEWSFGVEGLAVNSDDGSFFGSVCGVDV